MYKDFLNMIKEEHGKLYIIRFATIVVMISIFNC